jgi:hypothetical protein
MALTKITSTNIGANAVTTSAVNLTAPLSFANSSATALTLLANGAIGIAGDPYYSYKLAVNGPIVATTGFYIEGGTRGGYATSLTNDGGNASGNNAFRVMNASGNILLNSTYGGAVTTPYQPVFHAYPTSSWNVGADGVNTSPITGSNFNATEINIGSHFNSSNTRFTAPVAGSYYFVFNITAESDPGTVIEAKLWVNGQERRRHYYRAGTNVTAYESAIVAGILQLSAGDYVQPGIYTSASYTIGGGQSAGLAHYTYFSGFLLG